MTDDREAALSNWKSKQTIEGWECIVTTWDIGQVRVARLAGHPLAVYCPGDGSLSCTPSVPPAVLTWLITPPLADTLTAERYMEETLGLLVRVSEEDWRRADRAYRAANHLVFPLDATGEMTLRELVTIRRVAIQILKTFPTLPTVEPE